MIIYMPLEHIDMRYTNHMDRDIRSYLNKKNIEHVILEPDVMTSEIKSGSFLDAPNTIYRQSKQMMELCRLIAYDKIPKDSTIFMSDLWGFAPLMIPYLNFFSDYNIKIKGIIHAGSFTDTDFVRQMERYYKGFEDIIFDIVEEIFVASNFIKNDLIQKRVVQQDKIKVTKLPLDFCDAKSDSVRKRKVIFNGRNVDEKQPWLFDRLSKEIKNAEFVNTHKLKLKKDDYYKLLSESNCVVSFALQENFGYGIQEAVLRGCVPVLPNRLAYKEQFSKDYLYDSFDECVAMVNKSLDSQLPCPPCWVDSNDDIFKEWFKC